MLQAGVPLQQPPTQSATPASLIGFFQLYGSASAGGSMKRGLFASRLSPPVRWGGGAVGRAGGRSGSISD